MEASAPQRYTNSKKKLLPTSQRLVCFLKLTLSLQKKR